MAIEVHFEKLINNHVIREADVKSHRDYIVVTILASMFLFGLFTYGWQHYQSTQYGYRIEEAKKRKEQLAEVGRQLILEKETLRNPQRIDSIARRDLGMVIPAAGQLITLNADAPLASPAPQVPEPQPQPATLAAKR